jgi:hypothetical protein
MFHDNTGVEISPTKIAQSCKAVPVSGNRSICALYDWKSLKDDESKLDALHSAGCREPTNRSDRHTTVPSKSVQGSFFSSSSGVVFALTDHSMLPHQKHDSNGEYYWTTSPVSAWPIKAQKQAPIQLQMGKSILSVRSHEKRGFMPPRHHAKQLRAASCNAFARSSCIIGGQC